MSQPLQPKLRALGLQLFWRQHLKSWRARWNIRWDKRSHEFFILLCITLGLIKWNRLFSPSQTHTCLNIFKACSGINYTLKKCLRSVRHTLFKRGYIAKNQEKQRSAVPASWRDLTSVFSLQAQPCPRQIHSTLCSLSIQKVFVSVFVKVQACYKLETFICSKCQNIAELQFASLSPSS